jgi:RNA polymerase sigma factor (TIGR02999 family)
MADGDDVTALLERMAQGDASAREALLTRVYDQLRALARKKMAAERAGHTLSATALVHEAYAVLARQEGARLTDRAHFLALASLAMRRILVTHARKRDADKRGAGDRAITLDEQIRADGLAVDDVVALDDAITRLSALSERQAQVVAHRAFGALTDAEIAEVVGVSIPTVRRDYRLGIAWLRRELTG